MSHLDRFFSVRDLSIWKACSCGVASVHRPLGRVERLFLILDLDRLIVPAPETFPKSLITFRGFAGLAPPCFVVVAIVRLSSWLL